MVSKATSLSGEWGDTEKYFQHSDKVVFFDGALNQARNKIAFSSEEFQEGNTYTVLIVDNKLILGKNIPALDDPTKIGGRGSHVNLYNYYDHSPDKSFTKWKDQSGAIGIGKNGVINISGFHRGEKNFSAAEKMQSLILQICPYCKTEITDDTLEALGHKMPAANAKISTNNISNILPSFQKLEDSFQKSKKVRFFKGRSEKFGNDIQFTPGKSYTVIIEKKQIIIGEDIPGIGGILGGPKSHNTLNTYLNLPDYDPPRYLHKAGAIKVNLNGSIEISGYHYEMRSTPAADSIESIIKEINPEIKTFKTPNQIGQ